MEPEDSAKELVKVATCVKVLRKVKLCYLAEYAWLCSAMDFAYF